MSTFLADIAGSAGLRNAALIGLGGLVIALLASVAARDRPPLPLGGALVALASLLVLWQRFPVPTMVVVGCVLMGAASLLGTTIGERFVGNLVGAMLLTFSVGAEAALHPVITGVAIALAAALVTDHDAAFRNAASTMPLFLGSAVGVLLTVPDTEQAMVLVGAALPMALLGWPARIGSFGPAGAAAIGVLGYIAIGSVRAGGVVGAIGSLGLLLAEPLGRLLGRDGRTALQTVAATRGPGFYAVVLIHGVLVFGASRIAGLQQSAGMALILLVPFLLVGVVVAAAPAPSSPVADQDASSP